MSVFADRRDEQQYLFHVEGARQQKLSELLAVLSIAASVPRCQSCGGGGVVADLRKINKTGNPFWNKRCPSCRGSGRSER